MKTQSFTVPPMSALGFSVSHVELDAASPLNQNESHIHRECEIYLNLSGDVSFEVEGRIYPVRRGSAIITRPCEFHHCIYHSGARHEHFWITFSAEENEEFLKIFFGREKGRENLILLDPAQLEEICSVLDGLLEQEPDPLDLRIQCLRVFQILNDGKRESPIGAPQKLPPDVAAALRFMDEHLTEDVDIRALAAAGNVSVNTLELHFKASLRVTPFAMLRKKRLFASMQHLRGGASVAEAAMESGFPDYSHYIQLFKKQFGMTPLAYKRNLNRNR